MINFDIILSNKIKNKKLNKLEIDSAIKQIVDGSIPDYKIAAFLTAIYINGMNDDELFNLTISMRDSGNTINFLDKGYIIDKHSTGGIGDKVTLIVTPIVASLGLKVAKMSGTGLGITGGTIDKLNSVNIKTKLSIIDAEKMLDKYNMFLIEQTSGMVPADGILYKLRDVTSTIDSIPLIISSIMSKKLAIKSNHIYLDVKVGKGAFFSNNIEAKLFSKKAIFIAKKCKQKLTCSLTDMNKPLGNAIGNRLEIYESLKFLNGEFISKKLKELIYFFIGEIMIDANIINSMSEAKLKIDDLIKSKKPLTLFLEYARELGYEEKNSFETIIEAKYTQDIKAKKYGYFNSPNAYIIGMIALDMKAGRKLKSDIIDPYAGILFLKDENEIVEENEIIARLYSSNKIHQEIIDRVNDSIKISKSKARESKIIIEVINE